VHILNIELCHAELACPPFAWRSLACLLPAKE